MKLILETQIMCCSLHTRGVYVYVSLEGNFVKYGRVESKTIQTVHERE